MLLWQDIKQIPRVLKTLVCARITSVYKREISHDLAAARGYVFLRLQNEIFLISPHWLSGAPRRAFTCHHCPNTELFMQ